MLLVGVGWNGDSGSCSPGRRILGFFFIGYTLLSWNLSNYRLVGDEHSIPCTII